MQDRYRVDWTYESFPKILRVTPDTDPRDSKPFADCQDEIIRLFDYHRLHAEKIINETRALQPADIPPATT